MRDIYKESIKGHNFFDEAFMEELYKDGIRTIGKLLDTLCTHEKRTLFDTKYYIPNGESIKVANQCDILRVGDIGVRRVHVLIKIGYTTLQKLSVADRTHLHPRFVRYILHHEPKMMVPSVTHTRQWIDDAKYLYTHERKVYGKGSTP